MNITDALDSARIAYHLDTRAKYRISDTDKAGLTVEYVRGESSSETLEKAVALDPCPLLLVTASGRVIVLSSGTTGTIAIEGVDSANDSQTEILASIGKAVYESFKGQLKDFYSAPSSGRKKPKPEPPIESVDEEPVAADPSPEEIDSSEPTE
jgi:hypothetical protein